MAKAKSNNNSPEIEALNETEESFEAERVSKYSKSSRDAELVENEAEPQKTLDEEPAKEPTVRPVSLNGKAPIAGTPVGALADEDLEAVTAYKTLEARKRRTRRNKIIAGSIVGVLALAGLGWWGINHIGDTSASTEGNMPGYDIGFALLDTYENSVSASGAIKPASQVVVTPEVEGIIQDIRVAEGDEVLKGDVLFTLKNDTLDKAVQDAEQALKSAENGVTSAQNSLNSAYGTMSNAQANYNKVFATLYDTQEIADAAGAEATDQLNAATDAYNASVLALEDAQIAATKAQEALDDALATADKRTVRAPESGAIVAMNAEAGASVGSVSGSTASSSLMTIADLSSLRVSVQVNEVDINNLKEGQKAEVTFSALPDVVLEATVDHIAAISSGSGDDYAGSGIVTYAVDLVIEDPDPQVKPGMTARVKVLTEQIENALTVPAAALQMVDDTEALIYVAPGYDGTGEPDFEERTVSVVAKDASTAVIEGNVADGDAVQVFYDSSDDGSAWEVTMG